jgi:uncharacterized protein (TIGR02266 family)
MINDRKYIRVEIDSISNIKRQAISKQFEEELKAKVLNISTGGIYVETNHPLPEGTLFEFEFKLPDSKTVIKAKGMITWVSRKMNSSGMGIKFIKISTENKKAIIDYIEKKLAEKGMNLEEFSLGGTRNNVSNGFEGLIFDEVHQKFLKLYFKEIGFDMEIKTILEKIKCQEDDLYFAINTFEKLGIILKEKSKVNFYYAEDQKLRSQIENWIRENGA